jgi:undecaprenyl diphosphate synthase
MEYGVLGNCVPPTPRTLRIPPVFTVLLCASFSMSLRAQNVIHVIGTLKHNDRLAASAVTATSTIGDDYAGIGSDSVASTGSRALWLLPDNVSHSCGGHLSGGSGTAEASNASCSASCSPQGQHLLWKTLRWIKVIAVKVGRSYYALPVALLLSVLLLGLLLGFVVGRRYERRTTQRRRDRPVEKLHHQTKGSSASPIFKDDNQPSSPMRLRSLFAWSWIQYLKGLFYWDVAVHTLRTAMRQCTACPPPYSSWRQESGCNRAVNAKSTGKPANDPPLLDIGSDLAMRERMARLELKSDAETRQESNLTDEELPRHVAVIMDGNRRYGKQKYGNALQGHWDGSRKLIQFAKWCIAEHIPQLTVYAFSTENWHRDATEVAALMSLIVQHCEELRVEAAQQQISVRIASSDASAIPHHIRDALGQLERDTQSGTALVMNICLSYGSRGEIVHACRMVAEQHRSGLVAARDIDEQCIAAHMLIQSEPDLLIRTSGEMRISNFMLWQLAYTELFFLPKNWPELEKKDLLGVLQSYARGRQRRFGK